MTKLKPCPFCGTDKAELCSTSVYWVRCDNCGAESVCGNDGTEEEVIEIWNTRAEQVELTTLRQQNADLVEFVNEFKRYVPLAIDGNCLKVMKIEKLISKIKGDQDERQTYR